MEIRYQNDLSDWLILNEYVDKKHRKNQPIFFIALAILFVTVIDSVFLPLRIHVFFLLIPPFTFLVKLLFKYIGREDVKAVQGDFTGFKTIKVEKDNFQFEKDDVTIKAPTKKFSLLDNYKKRLIFSLGNSQYFIIKKTSFETEDFYKEFISCIRKN